jgi:Zn-dependent peptidase ImmA (M78 family)
LNDPNDASDFVLHELKTTETTAYRELKKAKTSEEAARIFALHFLRPKGAETKDSNNIHNMAGRIKNAQALG